MTVDECFTRDQLQQFLLGKLPEPQADLVAEHLDQCEICEDTVVGLDGNSDTLVGLLKADVEDGSCQLDANGQQSNVDFDLAVKKIQNFDFAPVSGQKADANRFDQIGEYEIGGQIAAGGMGRVYRARHVRLEKQVAIKVLPERKMQNDDAIARFSREMKIVGQLDHPAMVRATDAGEIDGQHFLVMELVEGLDLSKIARRLGRLAVADAAQVIRMAALGLHHAHGRGVVHRDVKPSNLMLNRDGQVKILDLGLATLGGLDGAVDELTTVGQLMGTLDYMAPEQFGSNHSVTAQTDVYGLAATIYKLLTGAAPYSHPAIDTPLKKLKAMATQRPTPIADRRPELPRELSSVIDRCLLSDPNERLASALELADALEPFASGHALKKLLGVAESLASQTQTQRPPNSSSLKVDMAKRKTKTAVVEPAAANGRELIDAPAANANRSRVRRWMDAGVALAMLGLMSWGGILIYLNTTAGQLVIESEVDDLKVMIVQGETTTKQLSVEHGTQATKLRAGKYRIEIQGDSDRLAIDNDQFELKRGQNVIARITRKATASQFGLANDGKLEVDQPQESSLVYRGKNLDAYSKMFLMRRSNEQIAKNGIYELVPMSKSADIEKIVSSLITTHQNEVYWHTQATVIQGLAHIVAADSQRKPLHLVERLFEYADDVVNRDARTFKRNDGGRPENFSNVLAPLIEQYDDFAGDFFLKRYADGSFQTKLLALSCLIEARAKEKKAISDQWVNATLPELPLNCQIYKSKVEPGDEATKLAKKVYKLVLRSQASENPRLLGRLVEMVERSTEQKLRHYVLEDLVVLKPDLPKMTDYLRSALVEGFAPEHLAHCIEKGDGLALIEQYLSDPDAGIPDQNDTAGSRRGGGLGGFGGGPSGGGGLGGGLSGLSGGLGGGNAVGVGGGFSGLGAMGTSGGSLGVGGHHPDDRRLRLIVGIGNKFDFEAQNKVDVEIRDRLLEILQQELKRNKARQFIVDATKSTIEVVKMRPTR